MAKKSKFFVVATEGATTDGREISRQWIEEMASTYNPKTYGARVNIEHIRGLHPDSDFKRFGDVIALKAEENSDGKLQLLAQIDPTPELVEMNKSRQKIYTSVEIHPNFAKTGKAYLMGLAVTDDPASLGTEILQFAAHAKNNPFTARKQNPDNLFSMAHETALIFEEEPAQPEGESLLSRVSNLIGLSKKSSDHRFNDVSEAVTLLSTSLSEQIERNEQLSTSLSELEEKVESLSNKLAEYESSPAPTPNYSHNYPTATGDNSIGQFVY